MQDYTIINKKKTLTSREINDNKKRIVERVYYDPNGTINEKTIWKYDKNGIEKFFMIIDKNGKLSSFAINIYEHSQLAKIIWFKKNDTH